MIVGAAKSGTTSLYEYLRQHPDVFMPDWKEPAFFAPPEAGGVTTPDAYRQLFSGATGQKAIGEASVAYLYVPEAPQQIADLLGPSVKIIVLLRNPIDMAYSNWGHQVREGYEELPFAEAIKKENERLADPGFFRRVGTWAANLAYLGRAHYPPQLENYIKALPSNNMKIYIYEDFFKPDLPLWQDLCSFLGIDPAFRPQAETFNQAGMPRSRVLQHFLNRPRRLKTMIKLLIPGSLRAKMREKLEVINRKSGKLPALDKELRRSLQEVFQPDVRWLEEKLGRSLRDVWF